MIIQSRIRQSFRQTGGFVLTKGENHLIDPLSDRARKIVDALVKAKLVEIVPPPETAIEATPPAKDETEPSEPSDATSEGDAPAPLPTWATASVDPRTGSGTTKPAPGAPRKPRARKSPAST